MSLDLDAPISTYFQLTNEHDADAVAALFTDDALVHDENSDYRGHEAIRDWAHMTYQKYGVTVTPFAAHSDHAATVVTAKIAGTFPGSPIELAHIFVIEGPRINELRIG